MASKPSGSPAPCAARTQRPVLKEARLCTGAYDKDKAPDRKRGRGVKRSNSGGSDKVYAVDWTFPAGVPITRRELEVLEQNLRASIEEILRM